MPLLQKVIKVGHSRMIVLPSSWLKYNEQKMGEEIIEVAVEVDGDLRIRPLTKEDEKPGGGS